jgi:hypothetical protein
MTKKKKKMKLEKIRIFFIKNCNLLIPGLHKGRPSYSRSLQPSKENIQNFKTWKTSKLSIFVVIFALLDPDSDSRSGSTDLIESGSNPVSEHCFKVYHTRFYVAKFIRTMPSEALGHAFFLPRRKGFLQMKWRRNGS